MVRRILALARKEFLQIRRDKRTLAMMVLIPVVWLVLFGYAFTFDIDDIHIAVVDSSATSLGATVARAFEDYDRFDVVRLADTSEAGVRDAIRRDRITMAVLLPPGFGDFTAAASTESDGAATPGPAAMRILLDGSNLFGAQAAARLVQDVMGPVQAEVRTEVAAHFRQELQAQLRTFAQQRAASVVADAPLSLKPQLVALMAKAAAAPPPAVDLSLAPPSTTPDVTILYNPDLKSAPVMIPGLLGMVVMFMTTLMTALGVVREREHGTMEQLVVTPLRPAELMLGKIIPYFFVGMLDFVLVYVAGIVLFHLTFAGNLALFLALSLLLVFTTLGLGLLVSTLAQNQQQAMQMAIMVIMPQVLVSGMIFPLTSLPRWIQVVAYALPFTHYVPIARGMFIKGQGLDLLWLPATVLAVYAVAVVTLASVRFRKRLA